MCHTDCPLRGAPRGGSRAGWGGVAGCGGEVPEHDGAALLEELVRAAQRAGLVAPQVDVLVGGRRPPAQRLRLGAVAEPDDSAPTLPE